MVTGVQTCALPIFGGTAILKMVRETLKERTGMGLSAAGVRGNPIRGYTFEDVLLGNRLSAVISWMLTVGWETVLCILATLASATVLEALGWHNTVGTQIVSFLSMSTRSGSRWPLSKRCILVWLTTTSPWT